MKVNECVCVCATALLLGNSLSAATVPVQARTPISVNPDLVVSPSLPVANTAVKVSLYEAPAEKIQGELTITDPEGEIVLREKVTPEDRELLTWTPARTGYHTIVYAAEDGTTFRLDQVPVVWQRMTFVSWLPLSPEDSERFPFLTSTVIWYFRRMPEKLEEWHRRGSTVLGNVYYRAGSMLKPDRPEEAVIEDLVTRWAAPLEAGADGMWIDELGAYPNDAGLERVRLEMKALKVLRDRYPDKILSSAVGGAILPECAAGHKVADALVTSEMYPEFHNMVHGTHSVERHIDARVETMRNTDLIFERGYSRDDIPPDRWRRHGGILLLSINHIGGGLWEEPVVARTESYIRYIKKTAPEMPGIGFYGGGGLDEYMEAAGIIEGLERMVEKYYVRPVVDVRNLFFSNYEPRVGKILPIHIGIHNVGGMDARNVTVRVYALGPDGDRVQVGEVHIDRLGTGFDSIEYEGDKPGFVEKHGNTYSLVPGRTHVAFRARQTRTVEWTPPTAGHYKIMAVVQPNDDAFTTLTGCIESECFVR